MKLQELPLSLSVCRMEPTSALPAWASARSSFFSMTKTGEELSIVCESVLVPPGIKAENDWKAFKVVGPLDFSLTGILASIANPLADAKISLFAISTFDTDYVLVRATTWDQTRNALTNSGFEFV